MSTSPNRWFQAFFLGGGGILVALIALFGDTLVAAIEGWVQLRSDSNKKNNERPTAHIVAFGPETTEISGTTELDYTVGEELTLDGGDSNDNDGNITTYEWQINGLVVANENYIFLTKDNYSQYFTPGNTSNNRYRVNFRVVDNNGSENNINFWIRVNLDPQQSDSYEWIPVDYSTDLDNLRPFEVGQERNQTRYLCRSFVESGYRIGKTVGGNCNVAFYTDLEVVGPVLIETPGENELVLSDYQILVDERDDLYWVKYETSDGQNFPNNAVKFAASAIADEESLVCKAEYKGAEHPGIVEEGFCLFSYRGAVGFSPNAETSSFSILVSRP